MKHCKWRLAAGALSLCLALSGCGGGGSSSSSSGGGLAQGSDPLVNGSAVSSGLVEQEELHMMTVDETVAFFKTYKPSQLGLEGESMEEYQVYPIEKAIPVDGLPCMKMTVYSSSQAGTNQPTGTFLVARDGTAVYKLDGETVTKVE